MMSLVSPPAPRRVALALALATLSLSSTITAGCVTAPREVATRPPQADDWSAWLTLEPLGQAARAFVDKPTRQTLTAASKLLVDGAALSADELLRRAESGPHGAWISVARANILALHFTACIRGVAWRLEDRTPDAVLRRSVDFSEDTRLGRGDVSVEATLSNLERAFTGPGSEALRRQARIARARVTATVMSCPPNEAVAELAQRTARDDLAALAAENVLPPDLAFVWGQIQMTDYSAAAARPFLVRALDGGFADPSVVFMLAAVALELRDHEEASARALESASAFESLGDRDRAAQAHALRGEALWRAAQETDTPDLTTARQSFETALSLSAGEPSAILGLARIARLEGVAPREVLAARLSSLYGSGGLDEAAARQLSGRLEAIVYITDEDLELSQTLRDALLSEIDLDEDPGRRALRYFFAAVLDARLGEFSTAHGRAAIAAMEAEELDFPMPIDIRAFMDRVSPAR